VSCELEGCGVETKDHVSLSDLLKNTKGGIPSEMEVGKNLKEVRGWGGKEDMTYPNKFSRGPFLGLDRRKKVAVWGEKRDGNRVTRRVVSIGQQIGSLPLRGGKTSSRLP